MSKLAFVFGEHVCEGVLELTYSVAIGTSRVIVPLLLIR